MSHQDKTERSIRVAHTITRFIRGGADENTLITCNGQVELGHEIHLIVGAETHPDILAELDPRVRLHRMNCLVRQISPIDDLRASKALFGLFRAIRPHIVHTHESKAGILGRWAAWAAGVPVIVHGVHILAFVGNDSVSRHIYRGVEWMTARITNAFVDVSEGMRDACLAAGIGTPQKHYLVPSGMDIDRFRGAARPVCWEDTVDPSLIAPEVYSAGRPQFVLASGALEPRKRIGTLVKSFQQVTAENAQAVLLIAGDGYLRREIARQIDQSGLGGRVLLLGHCTNLEQLIALADICIHVAEREGLPRVVVQYVAVGRPVITTPLPGIESLVRHGVNGYYLPEGDADAAASLILRLLASDELRSAFERASRNIDLTEWTSSAMVERISGVYRQFFDFLD